MADDKTSTAEKDETYHVDRLVAEAGDRFGVPPHVAAGAFSGQSRKNLTLDQADKIIKKWVDTEVEVDNPITPEQPGADLEEGSEA